MAKDYRVVWEIDIIADSPEEAARQAREFQIKEGTSAKVFDVFDGQDCTRVDLYEIDDQATECADPFNSATRPETA
jgi:hypothetical protein